MKLNVNQVNKRTPLYSLLNDNSLSVENLSSTQRWQTWSRGIAFVNVNRVEMLPYLHFWNWKKIYNFAIKNIYISAFTCKYVGPYV